tara:strand:- start:7625 stop:8560 length:936 start_codon:yes stop_codon:yes gene_type:complete
MPQNNREEIIPVKIVVAGMPQGGTTALYNMVNFIYRANAHGVANFLYHPTEAHWRVNPDYAAASKKHYKPLLTPDDYADYCDKIAASETRSETVNEESLRIMAKEVAAGNYTEWKITDAEGRIMQPSEDYNCILVKEHHYNSFLCDEWADIVFVMRRDIRDSIASRRRRGKPLISKALRLAGIQTYDPETFDGFREWCEHITKDCYQSWVDSAKKENKSIYCLDYIQYKKDPHKIIKEVFYKITDETKHDLKLDSQGLLNALNHLHVFPKQITFFSEPMVTNAGSEQAYKELLSSKELDFIEQEYSDWVNI